MKPYELFYALLQTTNKEEFLNLLRMHRDDRVHEPKA